MTDFERLMVAWELWTRRSAAVASGVRLGPVLMGMLAAGAMVGGAALKPVFG